MQKIKTFNPLDFSSKFGICGLPIRLDTYKTCGFQCKYCFSNGNAFGNKNNKLEIGSTRAIKMRLDKIFKRKEIEKFKLLDFLIAQGYTWHCGGMSDPFQPIENSIHATRNIINITNDFNIYILFSTKSNTYYDVPLNPKLHSFQLSVTNVNNRTDIQPNVPDIEQRIKFYNQLKDKGFKVGIRLQPFIPNITTIDIIKKFPNADHYVLESIKSVPGNWQHRKIVQEISGLKDSDFKRMGLMNVLPELKLKWYQPFIEYFNQNNLSYSIADNDLHNLGNNKCCCGDTLCFNKTSTFNNTYLLHTYGIDYTLQNLLDELNKTQLGECKFRQHFNRVGDQICTVREFFTEKYNSSKNPLSPKFLYINKEKKENV